MGGFVVSGCASGRGFLAIGTRNSLRFIRSYAILVPDMIEVTRKDSKESAENLVRRFNRRVQQSGLIIAVKQGQYFEKPISKRERRAKAIIRNQRKALKLKKIKLGQR